MGDKAKRVPRFLVSWLKRRLHQDEVNAFLEKEGDIQGVPWVEDVVEYLGMKLVIEGEENLPAVDDPKRYTFVSNHPLGALDGITLLHLVGRHRPDFKVMVNMFLNHISAMRPSFIAVDPFASDDPVKKATSVKGIREAIKRVKSGSPIGFFPAGAMSRVNKELRIMDREWQPTILNLIRKLEVPVVPIYFHDRNSAIFNILGAISWQLRTLRLPTEVFLRKGKQMHISIGEPISVEEQKQCGSIEELGKYLYDKTYSLRSYK